MDRGWRLAERRNDHEWEDVDIAQVADEGDGWGIERADGWSFWIAKKHGVEPHVGDRARFYGRGIGSPVRGVELDGVPVYYETAAEYEARFDRELTEKKAQDRIRYEAELAETNARIVTLPPEFQARIAGFRARNPDFWEHEGYELFTCEQAVVIADALKTADAITAFHALPWDEQKAQVPGLDDGHSGNTFGAACGLARIYVSEPQYVATAHGALCPLVGCQEYGCWAASADAARARAQAAAR